MPEVIKVVTPDNLSRFKANQDEANDAEFAKKGQIPTLVSQLGNDAGYQTANDLQVAIANALSGVMHWKGTVDSEASLPIEAEPGDIYHANDTGDEFAWNGEAWEKLGGVLKVSWGEIDGRPTAFPPEAHRHLVSQIDDFPSSMPASDVYAWAKAPSKPTYSAAEVGAAASSHSHPNMVGSTPSNGGTAGFVPAPAAGQHGAYLRGDGIWSTPPNTTYGLATAVSDGLMSSSDKSKLDGLTAVEPMTDDEIDALFA